MSFDEDNRPFAADQLESVDDVPDGVFPEGAVEVLRMGTSDTPAAPTTAVADDATDVNDLPVLPSAPNGAASLLADPETTISVVEAGKLTEGASRGYTVYTIKLMLMLIRRRYLEFESLHTILCRIFPLVMIPPIPGKHYNFNSLLLLATGNGSGGLGSGASGNGQHVNGLESRRGSASGAVIQLLTPQPSADHDTQLVEHRKKMLDLFLRECLKIEQVRLLPLFHSFLDPNANFTDDFKRRELKQLPPSNLCANPYNGLDTFENPVYLYMPIVSKSGPVAPSEGSGSAPASSPDLSSPQFERSAFDYVNLYCTVVRTHDFSFLLDLDRANKRIYKHWQQLLEFYGAGGRQLNAFSLTEADARNSELLLVLEKLGTLYDQLNLVTDTFVDFIGLHFNDYWRFYLQCFDTVTSILNFREAKYQQREVIATSLLLAKQQWLKFMESDGEYRRLNKVLNQLQDATRGRLDLTRDQAATSGSSGVPPVPTDDIPFEPIVSPNPKQPLRLRRAFGYTIPLLLKITSAIADVVSQQPELTREQKQAQLRQQVNIQQQCLALADADLAKLDEFVNQQFERHHTEQTTLLRKLVRQYCASMIETSDKLLDTWNEARMEIADIHL